MKSFTSFTLIGMVALLLVSIGGCMDLAVENQNNPDRERALAAPSDVESLIGGSFLTWWSATQKASSGLGRPGITLSVMADANTSSWGNFGMQNLSSEPRTAFDNTTSARYPANLSSWYEIYSAISAVNDGLIAINKGLIIKDEQGKDHTMRAKAFAKFVQGLSHGWLALFFDKAFIVDEKVDLETAKLDFSPYDEVMRVALQQLQECITLCDANTFTLPDTWINGLPLSNGELKRLAYSTMARFRASVARSPQERAAVDWNKVISDARNGITEDFAPIGDTNFWWDGVKWYGNRHSWCRADYKTIGITDKSGNYQNWLNTTAADRQPVQITTDDRRITGAGGPKTAGTDFAYRSPSPFRADRGTYHHSLYYHKRYIDHLTSGGAGPMAHTTVVEMKHLIAEGLLRQGQDKQQVVDIINSTRVNRGKLPPVTTAMSTTELEKWLHYEKMIETFDTGSGLPWFDRRGWGELVQGTLIQFPVPGKELDVLQLQAYTFGGEGNPGGAPKRARVPNPGRANLEPII